MGFATSWLRRLFAEQNSEDWPRYNRETSIRVACELKVGWDGDGSSPFERSLLLEYRIPPVPRLSDWEIISPVHPIIQVSRYLSQNSSIFWSRQIRKQGEQFSGKKVHRLLKASRTGYRDARLNTRLSFVFLYILEKTSSVPGPILTRRRNFNRSLTRSFAKLGSPSMEKWGKYEAGR